MSVVGAPDRAGLGSAADGSRDRRSPAADTASVVGGVQGLVVGLGLRPGTAAETILAALAEITGLPAGAALAEADPRIICLATIDRRAAEPGPRAVAAALGVPLYGYCAAELADISVAQPSARTAAALGTPSVAEAAALLASGAAELAQPRRVVAGVVLAAAVPDDHGVGVVESTPPTSVRRPRS